MSNMYVQYKCDCGAFVNSNLEYCPQCGAELPEFTLEHDYDAEAEEVTEASAEPDTLKAKIALFYYTYTSHLIQAYAIDIAEEVEEREKIRALLAERGPWAVRWYKLKRFFLLTLGIIAFFAWMVIGLAIVGEQGDFDNEQQVFGNLILVAFFPLYLVSIWLVVKHDDRPAPLWQKILQSLWGAANRLIFAFLFLVVVFLVVKTMIDFVIPGLFE